MQEYIKEEDKLLINFLMLYQAILFSDYDNGANKVVCVYDTKENHRLVAVFNNDKTCARFFNTTKEVVQSMRSKNILLKGRFSTEIFECETTSSKAEFYQIMNDKENKKSMSYLEKHNGYSKVF